MKQILIFSIAVFTAFNTYAQSLRSKTDIKKGELFKISRGNIHSKVMRGDDGELYAFETGWSGFKKKGAIVKLDKNLVPIKETDLELKFKSRTHEFEGLFYVNDKMYLLSSDEDRKTKRNILYLRSINKSTLEPNQDEQVISTINYQEGSKNNSGSFEVRFSPDRKKLMIFNLLPYDRNEVMRYTASILDVEDNLRLIWSKSFETKAENKLVDLITKQIDDNGDIAILFKHFKEKRKDVLNGNLNYFFTVQLITDDGEEKHVVPINLKGSKIYDMQLAFMDDNDIVATGFYTDREKGYGIKGAYYIKMDPRSKDIKKESTMAFTLDFMTDFMREKTVKKVKKRAEKGKDVELTNFRLSDLVKRDDGGIIQVAEEYYVTTHVNTDANGNTTYTYIYHFNTLLVISISPEGEIEWARKIPKFQTSRSPFPAYASYYLEVVNNNLYFFHIDNSKNLAAENYKDMKGFTVGKNSVLMMTEINVEGNMNKDAIIEARFDKTNPIPVVSTTLDNDDILMFAYDKGKGRYYKISIKE